MAREVAKAVRVWDASAETFGGVLSRSKCTLSANTPLTGKKLLKATAGEGIPLVKEAKDLGAPSTGGGRPANRNHERAANPSGGPRLQDAPPAGGRCQG